MDIRINTWNMHTPDDPTSTAKRRQTCTQLFFLCRFFLNLIFYVNKEHCHSLKNWQLFWRPIADNCNICCQTRTGRRQLACRSTRCVSYVRPMTLVGGSQTTMTSNVRVGRSSSYRVAETITKPHTAVRGCHSSGAVWESRWTSWAVRPNEPSGFRGRKDLLHRASALVTTCP